jgi:hypothetical protein
MATRIRDRAAISSMERAGKKETPSSGSPAVPLTGRLEAMPIASVLAALELDRRSGVVRIHAPDTLALDLVLAGGLLVGGRQGGAGLDPAEALRRALAPSVGRLDFVPGEAHAAPPRAVTLARLLIHVLGGEARPPAPEVAPAPAPPPPPSPTSKPRPARRTTLRSQAAVSDVPPHRSSSERIAAAISVEESADRVSAPAPAPSSNEPPDEDDVVIADNDSTR